MKRTLTTNDLLKALPTSVSRDSIRRWARDGRVPCDVTPGGHRRYDLDEVLAAMSTQSRVHITKRLTAAGKVHLGKGAPVRSSAADVLHRQIRTVRSPAGPTGQLPGPTDERKTGLRKPSGPADAAPSAIVALLGQARRVMVAHEAR